MYQGFTENPFSSHLVEPARGGYIFADGDAGLDGVVESLRNCRWRGELCGPHGAGKSTLLTDICARLEAEELRLARWRCAEGSRMLPRGWLAQLRGADIVILDGGERLLPGLMWILRGMTVLWGKGLIMTTHRRLGGGAWIPVEPSAEALAVKVDKLVGGSVAGDGEQGRYEQSELVTHPAGEISRRLDRHGGNAREVLFELYVEHEERG